MDTRIQDLFSVFGWPYQVVVTGKDKVAHSSVRGHALIVEDMTVRGKPNEEEAGRTSSHGLTAGEFWRKD